MFIIIFLFMDGGNYMNKEKMIEKYFKDCILRKRLNEKTIKAYRIDLDQFSKWFINSIKNSDQGRE